MKATKRLNRRTFLRGATGAAIGLPLLEIMQPRSAAAADAATPCRYVVSMTGTTMQGTGGGGSGTSHTMPSAYASLEPIRDYVSIVTNLTVPTGPRGAEPPGGVDSAPGHGTMLVPMVTGRRRVGGAPTGASSDQIVAASLAAGTRFDALHYRVQAREYAGGVGYMSVSDSNFPVGPISSPRLAYDQLFAGFDPSAGGPSASDSLAQGASVLDLVLRRSQRLRQTLGAWDRQRLEEHFDQIRELELRMRQIQEGGGGSGANAGCEAIADPGADPTIVEGLGDSANPSGWAQEDQRARVFADLIHMAFVCDLSRVSTFMIGFLSSALNMKEVIGLNWDAHDTTHSPFSQAAGAQAQAMKEQVAQFFAEPFAYLMTKLRDTPEGTGNMLDNTVGVQLWEHGNPGAHNTTSYILPIVGCPNVLRQGQRIDGAGRHPSKVLQTAMAAVGVDQDFGDVPGVIDELL